ncbi:UDP-N-acetylglucosamine 2-epimerase (non-hydrolyzing) [Rhodobacteraceae bacterium XHP0102]|nr:UDP-N-acetylglucosamine 2-epimerase (non-hydrolyzing) [Rhodobacteraceae bacterium XHP0102]
MTKILTIVGARPQFIKAAAVSRLIRSDMANGISEIIVHTGQHYDPNMSQVFFDELNIPKPDYNLEIASGRHGEMTGRMIDGIESTLISEKPDIVLIYGDTNSTLAGALAASKLHIPIAHIEAGLRSFNKKMPEEINRIVSDHVSTFLFCPTETAVENLRNEGITSGVHNVGDVMYDVSLYYKDKALKESTILQACKLSPKDFILATCHRAENTDSAARLEAIFKALSLLAAQMPVVVPLHPRTKKKVLEYGFEKYLETMKILDPVGFLDMIALEQSASVIVTDSGGVQKEAYFYGVPCVTVRDETEWVETVELGWNSMSPAAVEDIMLKVDRMLSQPLPRSDCKPYGNGFSAQQILSQLSGR